MNEVTNEKVKPQSDAVKDVTICPTCRRVSKSTTLYCKCGTALNNECSHCGTRNLITARTCGKCKVKLL